ncbi:hypothetical protein BJ742DRAFT_772197 [Cladochytrium replicatum]|nr:hypothetical protein BJ742DRAFT_772197 [Cladochytrium replicatum]
MDNLLADLLAHPWVAYEVPFASGDDQQTQGISKSLNHPVRQIYLKSRFYKRGYAILATDMERVWFERVSDDGTVIRKALAFAKTFTDTGVSELLKLVKECINERKHVSKYRGVWKDDETGDFRLEVTSMVGDKGRKYQLRWTFEFSQSHSTQRNTVISDLRDRSVDDRVGMSRTEVPLLDDHPPGQLLHEHLIHPALLMLTEYRRRIELMMATLEKKDQEIESYRETLNMNSVRKIPARKTTDFDRNQFEKSCHHDMRSRLGDNAHKEVDLDSTFSDDYTKRMYDGIMEVLAESGSRHGEDDKVDYDRLAGALSSDIIDAPTLDIGGMAPSGYFQTLSSPIDLQSRQGGVASSSRRSAGLLSTSSDVEASPTKKSKEELQREKDLERLRELKEQNQKRKQTAQLSQQAKKKRLL